MSPATVMLGGAEQQPSSVAAEEPIPGPSGMQTGFDIREKMVTSHQDPGEIKSQGAEEGPIPSQTLMMEGSVNSMVRICMNSLFYGLKPC